MTTDEKICNLRKKLDRAARMSRKQSDAISLAHEAFYEVFERGLPDCKCCEIEGSPECKVNSLFWNYITESEMPEDIETSDDLVFEMLRLMNEIEKKGDE
jgi:hypothetical protein